MISIIQPASAVDQYNAGVRNTNVSGRNTMYQQYITAWADFWNQPIPTRNQQTGQMSANKGPNSQYSPADKLLFLGAQAAAHLDYANTARLAINSIFAKAPNADNSLTTVPGVPDGYQFLVNADGTAFLQKQTINTAVTPNTVTWTTVLPTTAGIAAATASGITIPAALQPAA